VFSCFRNHLVIQKIAVLPEYQGQGFGVILVQYLQAIACDLGLKVGVVSSEGEGFSSIYFWRQRDFAIIDVAPVQDTFPQSMKFINFFLLDYTPQYASHRASVF